MSFTPIMQRISQAQLPQNFVNILFFICMLHCCNKVSTFQLPEGQLAISRSIDVEKYSAYNSFSWTIVHVQSMLVATCPLTYKRKKRTILDKMSKIQLKNVCQD